MTTTSKQVRQIKTLAEQMEPDRIQLNTVARPPTEPDARPASPEELAEAAALLGPRAEVIADFALQKIEAQPTACAEDILDLLRRRPCALDDLASGLAAHPLEVGKQLERLVRAHRIAARHHGARVYYQPTSPASTRTDEPVEPPKETP